MKHLFNNIPNSEKQRILEMHGVKRKLVNESTEMIEKGKLMFNSLSEPEKMKLGEAIKECLKEHHQGTIAGFGLIMAIVGIGGLYLMVKTSGIDLISLGTGAIVFGMVKMEVDEIIKIIDCVKSKMNDTTNALKQVHEQLVNTSGTPKTDINYLALYNPKNPSEKVVIFKDGQQVAEKELVQNIQREYNVEQTGLINDKNFAPIMNKMYLQQCQGGTTEANPTVKGWRIETNKRCYSTTKTT